MTTWIKGSPQLSWASQIIAKEPCRDRLNRHHELVDAVVAVSNCANWETECDSIEVTLLERAQRAFRSASADARRDCELKDHLAFVHNQDGELDRDPHRAPEPLRTL